MNDEQIPICKLPWTTLQVDKPDGTAACCCLDRIERPWGNVIQEGWEAVWNGRIAQQHRKALLSGKTEGWCQPTCPILLARAGARTGITGTSYRSDACAENMALLQKDMRESQAVSSGVPVQVNLTVTFKCNHKCVMCGQGHDDAGEIPAEVYDTLSPWLDRICVVGASGGEAALSPAFMSFVKGLRMSERDYRPALGLITNGTVLSDKTIEEILSIGLSYLIVSLHAVRHETYRIIHNRDHFKRAKQFIERMLRYAQDPKKGFPLAVAFTVMPSNVREMAKFVSEWSSRRVWSYIIPERGGYYDSAERMRLASEIDTALDSIDRLPEENQAWIYGTISARDYAKRMREGLL